MAAILGVGILVAVIVAPWGNFPLNDDWIYAWHTLEMATWGTFVPQGPMNASFVLQGTIGSWITRAFGFSHVGLRVGTFCMAMLSVFAFERLLVLLNIPHRIRLLACLVLVFNPLFLHLAFSYMTEFWGLSLALWGVTLWFFIDKQRNAWPRWKSLSMLIGVGVLMGASFWVRQTAVIYLGALFLARGFQATIQRKNLWREFLWILPTGLASLFFIIGYFVWARVQHSMNPAFQVAMSGILKPQLGNILLQVPIWALYLTAFSLPLLPFLYSKKIYGPRMKYLMFFLVVCSIGIALGSNKNYHLQASLHAHFPILGNVMNPYGVGPITFSDVYLSNGPSQPTFYPWLWIALQGLLVFLLPVLLFSVRVPLQGPLRELRTEARYFGLLSIGLMWALMSFAFGQAVFDRYIFQVSFAILLILSLALNESAGWPKFSAGFAAVGFIAMAWYAIAGVHDYFRWNEVRWSVFEEAIAMGLSPQEVDGGYELNGWTNMVERLPERPVLYDCATLNWFCPKRPYRIGFNVFPTETLLLERPVPSLFARYPSVKLIRS